MKINSIIIQSLFASLFLSMGLFSCSSAGKNIYSEDTNVAGSSKTGNNKKDKQQTIVAGKLTDKVFNVPSAFTSVKSTGPVDIVFTQSANSADFSVKGRIPENIIEKMEVYVDEGVLHVSVKSGNHRIVYSNASHPTIYITNKSLKEVSTSGSGDFTINGNLQASDGFLIDSSGSSDFESGTIFTNGKDITIKMKGSGDIELKGVETKNLMVNISGSGDFDCYRIKSDKVSVNVSGSGDVEIGGTCADVSLSVTGSGDIDAKALKATSGKASVTGSGNIGCNVEELTKTVSGSGKISNRK